MGIPLFFKNISEKYRDIKMNSVKLKPGSMLLFDLNCLIHPCSSKVIKHSYSSNKEVLEQRIITEIKNYMDYIMSLNNTEYVYVAIDGVAPFAKMTQQRSRRYKSVYQKKMIKNIKTRLELPCEGEWDSNAISPGTEFMKKLTKELEIWLDSRRETIIFSSCDKPGEGEHKIMHFIKTNKIEGNIFIYGLDADLVMLSLTCKEKNIYLLREKIQDGKIVENVFIYCDIDRLKENIVTDFCDRFYGDQKNASVSINHNIIDDYVFICFFLGNDFVPHILTLDIRHSGLDIVMENYIYTLRMLDQPFIINNSINKKFLLYFISCLEKNENKTSIDIFEKRKRMNKFFNIRASTSLEQELQLIENNPILCLKEETQITYKPEGWMQRYYNNCFSADTSYEIDRISEEYIEGIYWTFSYYFKQCECWEWKYNYNYAPTLYHLKKYLETNNSPVVFNKKKPLAPLAQLFIILPSESYNLLPEKYHSYIFDKNSCLSHLYPTKYKFSRCFKRYDWQCTPILPYIDDTTLTIIKNI